MKGQKFPKQIYPEARNQTSQYMTGRRGLPQELKYSPEYKSSAIESIKSRLAEVTSQEGDVDSFLRVQEAKEAKDLASFKEAERVRELQKSADSFRDPFKNQDLPTHMKGKVNIADKLIESLGFEKTSPVGAISNLPTSKFSYLQKSTGRIIPGLAILSALGYSDLSGAATDFVVPGGVEEMGVSEEQKQLDRKYANRVRQLSERAK